MQFIQNHHSIWNRGTHSQLQANFILSIGGKGTGLAEKCNFKGQWISYIFFFFPLLSVVCSFSLKNATRVGNRKKKKITKRLQAIIVIKIIKIKIPYTGQNYSSHITWSTRRSFFELKTSSSSSYILKVISCCYYFWFSFLGMVMLIFLCIFILFLVFVSNNFWDIETYRYGKRGELHETY